MNYIFNVFKRLIYGIIRIVICILTGILEIPNFIFGIIVKPTVWVLTGKSLNDDYWIFGVFTFSSYLTRKLDNIFGFNK